jgi:UDP-N-acetylmuramyl pentapeptide phosphotransferase/UDP-N-acetylglucosamine-1-phosphate transferase
MVFIAAAALSALLCASLILALGPLLVRYALARPNARSTHKVPTPQGGGIAVVGAALVIAGLLTGLPSELVTVAAAALVLAILGAVDDIRPLHAAPRLLVQVLAVAAVVWASGVRVVPDLMPAWAERTLVVLAGVWFVNLVNFMDGLDWLTVAGMVPAVAAVAAIGATGTVTFSTGILAAALLGGLLGFAPFNRPVAKLFLGDVGSLPIGLVVGWLLLQLAATGTLAAAFLLPLYHLADASITLLRRLSRRERVWEAHRSHFYQQATVNGLSVLAVSLNVFALNVWLAVLACVTLIWPAPAVQVAAVLVGIATVGVILWRFSHPRTEAR